MKKQIIALVTAGSLATAGLSATPVQADPLDDLVRFAVAATVLGAIATAASGATTTPATTHVAHVPPRVHRPHRRHGHRHHAHHSHKPKHCKRKRHTRHGWVTYWGPRCMANHGFHRHNGRWHKHRRAHW